MIRLRLSFTFPSLLCLALLGSSAESAFSAIELLTAQTRGNLNGVTVTFSASVAEVTATNPANYTISPGVTVSNVTLIETAKVRLSTSLIAEGQTYVLTVNGVQDRAVPPVTIAAGSQIRFVQTQGVIQRKEFDNLTGISVSDLTNSAKFPGSPDSIGELTSLEAPTDIGDNYGQQIQGFLTAPTNGDYTFYLCSDDRSELYLSADETIAGRKRIAFEPDWNPARNWIGTDRRPNQENISAAIPLLAGHKYYIEVLMKEASGGDNVGVCWQLPGAPPPTNGAPPIAGAFLSSPDPVTPSSMSAQPANQTVAERSEVTFSVTLSGTPPFDYQWFRNGAAIEGATGATYTISSAQVTDNGAVFRVVAGNGLASTMSDPALLTVTPDTTPPGILSAHASADLTHMTIRFSEVIVASEANDPANYVLNGGLIVTGASLASDGQTVTLTTSPQTPGGSYSLTISGIRDTAATPNWLPTGTQLQINAFILSHGFLRREVWEGIPGGTVADLTNNARFPDFPDIVSYVNFAETPLAFGDNYGVRLSGLLLPPVTGDYVFYIASDDQGALFLSSDANPANKQNIARELSWSPSRQWTDAYSQASRGNPPSNVSVPIHLTAGQPYYFEAIMKESGGGDCLGVTWQIPGDAAPDKYSPPISGTYLAAYADPVGAAIQILTNPANVLVLDHQTATFTAIAVGTSRERFYQWQRDGHDIPGATGRSYTTPPVSIADDSARFRCVVNIPGASCASSEAVLTVVPDTQPPHLVGVEGSIGLDEVTATFDEAVNPSDAADTNHFALSGGLKVVEARLQPGGTNVVLRTTTQTEGNSYMLSVSGIHDASAAANLIPAGSQADFFAWMNEEFVGPFPNWADAKRDFGAIGDGLADDSDALQFALDSIGEGASVPYTTDVLWLPAGTYRITRQLNFFSRLSFSIVGEDPATTTIKWDGPQGGIMLWCNGASQGRVGRITFDGGGKALSCLDHKWDSLRPNSTTANEFADLVFKDAQFGLRAGIANNDAEVEVARCHFLRCSVVGLSLESFNALDWFVRDSVFEDCGYGVSNTYGAGHYHVYDSLFLRSTVSDCGIGNTSYFSIRRNTSIGSKAFFVAGFTQNPAEVTLEKNAIIDPLDDAPIRYATLGPMLLLDNVVRSRASQSQGPVVQASENLIAIGNTFTVAKPISSYGATMAFDNQIVDPATIEYRVPALPGTLPRRNRPVVEVSPGSGASAIQTAIYQADLLRGQRPVVHLPRGTYNLNATLVIPAGSDLQLVGDGYSETSILQWVGATGSTVLRVLGPTRATLREFSIRAGRVARAIALENCDQPGSRVWMDQANLSDCEQYGLRVDRLDECDVELPTFYHGGNRGGSLQVFGGPRADRGEHSPSRVTVLGGASGDNNITYRVDHGGHLLVQDSWYEGRVASPFARFSGHGGFTLHGANVAPDETGGLPVISFEQFSGRASFLMAAVGFRTNQVLIQPGNPALSVLFLGSLSGSTNYMLNHSTDAQFGHFSSHMWDNVTPWANHPDSDPVDYEFIRQMLQQTRQERRREHTPRLPSATDFRLFRVTAGQATSGMLITKTNAPPGFSGTPGTVTVAEGSTLEVPVLATDPDGSFNTLSFSLGAGAPMGVAINPTNGILSWTPAEDQGPSTNRVEVIVADDGSPSLQATNTFWILVAESNAAPHLGVQGYVTNTNIEGALDIGSPSDPVVPGSTTLNGDGSIDVIAGGSFIFGAPDTFHFSYQEVTGDFDAQVQVESLEAVQRFTVAGLVVRESLSPTARMALVAVMPEGPTRSGDPGFDQYYMIYRPTTGVSDVLWWPPTAPAIDPDVHYPNGWIRLRRAGNSFAAYRSDNGITWKQIGALTVSSPYPDKVLIGFYTASGGNSPGWTTTARYRNFAVTSPGLVAATHQSVAEHQPLTLLFGATDPDLPRQQLTFGFGQGAPSGAAINPTTGVFSWTPNEAQGPGDYQVTVTVTDDGVPALSDSLTFSVTVSETNAAPVLTVGNQITDEGVEWSYLPGVTDADLPTNTLSFALISGPAGAVIDQATGNIRWTPGEADGPGTVSFTVKVTENGVPPLSDTRSFSVTVREVNQAPQLMPVGDRTVDELSLLSFLVTAVDPDLPTNKLTFSLGPGSPAGAAISPTGLFSWTPTEAQAPSNYPVTILVTDDGTPNRSASTTITVTVDEVNSAPALAVVNQTLDEGTELRYRPSVTDADLPTNTLSFSLLTGPPGAVIDPVTGAIQWTPSEADGPGTATFTVKVTDNGTPSLTDTKSFSATVREVNRAPELVPAGNKTVNELSLLSFTVTAIDPDLPTNRLTFSLGPGSPAGAAVSSTGVFTWTPGEMQGPGDYPVTIVVTDDGVPNLSSSEVVTITVNEVNTAPILSPIADRTARLGETLRFFVSASDSDYPTNGLDFTLEPGAASGATIDARTGEFIWSPDVSQAPGTYSFTVHVEDDGAPKLSASGSFTVTLSQENIILQVVLTTDAKALLSWNAVSGRVYRVLGKQSLTDSAWSDLGEVIASSSNASFSEPFGAYSQRFYQVELVR